MTYIYICIYIYMYTHNMYMCIAVVYSYMYVVTFIRVAPKAHAHEFASQGRLARREVRNLKHNLNSKGSVDAS